jgi:hypothetical protein
VFIGVAAVLAFYAFTATLRGQPNTVSVVLCASLAVLIWRMWDPSFPAFALASTAALLGPSAEIGGVASGAIRYAADSSALFGVAPWLPCLYFAAGAVSSGLWRLVERSCTSTAQPPTRNSSRQ